MRTSSVSRTLVELDAALGNAHRRNERASLPDGAGRPGMLTVDEARSGKFATVFMHEDPR